MRSRVVARDDGYNGISVYKVTVIFIKFV